MTLRQQIVAGFGVLLVPTLLVAGIAFATIHELGGAVDAVLLENERSLRAAAEMDVALERLDSAALLALLGRSQEADALAAANRPRFCDALDAAAANLTIPGEGELVSAIEGAFAAYTSAFEAVVAAEQPEARTTYANELVPAFEQTRAGVEALRAANQEAAALAGREAGSMARTALWIVGLGALFAVALGVWAAAKLSRQIAQGHA